MEVQVYPQNGAPFAGMKLAKGAILQQDDVYNSTAGVWEQCPCPGLKLGATSTIWVRPRTELSENARLLLGYLNLRGGDLYGCIAERNGTYYVIPSPSFNWDSRLELLRVRYPECIRELVDYGYLTYGEHPTAEWHPDYSPAGICVSNSVYTLTEEGKHEGANILA